MRAATRREEWAVVDVDDLPVPPAPLHTTAVGPAARRLAETAHDAYRLAADHADLAASVDPHTATARQLGGLRIARRLAVAAVERAREAQRALGADIAGRRGSKWQAGIDTGRAVAARNVADAAHRLAVAASAFETVDRSQAWRDQALLAVTEGARWPVGFDAPARRVVIGSRRYPLADVLAAITVAYSSTSKELQQ